MAKVRIILKMACYGLLLVAVVATAFLIPWLYTRQQDAATLDRVQPLESESIAVVYPFQLSYPERVDALERWAHASREKERPLISSLSLNGVYTDLDLVYQRLEMVGLDPSLLGCFIRADYYTLQMEDSAVSLWSLLFAHEGMQIEILMDAYTTEIYGLKLWEVTQDETILDVFGAMDAIETNEIYAGKAPDWGMLIDEGSIMMQHNTLFNNAESVPVERSDDWVQVGDRMLPAVRYRLESHWPDSPVVSTGLTYTIRPEPLYRQKIITADGMLIDAVASLTYCLGVGCVDVFDRLERGDTGKDAAQTDQPGVYLYDLEQMYADKQAEKDAAEQAAQEPEN